MKSKEMTDDIVLLPFKPVPYFSAMLEKDDLSP